MQPWMAVYDGLLVDNEQSKRKMGVIHEKWTVFSIFIWTSILAIYVDQWIKVTLNKGLTMKGEYFEIKSWLLLMQRQPTESAK